MFLVSSVFLWRLSQGPVSLEPFIGFLEAQARDYLSGTDIHLTLGGARFHWPSWREAPSVTLRDLSILGTGGRPLGMVPEVKLRLSPGKLVRGELPVRSLEISRPVLYLVRRADGSIGMRMNLMDHSGAQDTPDSGSPDSSGDLSTWLSGGDGDDTGALLAALDQLAPLRSLLLSLREGVFIFENRQNGADFQIQDINVTVDVRPATIGLKVHGALPAPSVPRDATGDALGGAEPRGTGLGLSVNLMRGHSGLASVRLDVESLSLEEVARIAATVSGETPPSPGTGSASMPPARPGDPAPAAPGTGHTEAAGPEPMADDTSSGGPDTRDESLPAPDLAPGPMPKDLTGWSEAVRGRLNLSMLLQVDVPALLGRPATGSRGTAQNEPPPGPDQPPLAEPLELSERLRNGLRGASLRLESPAVSVALPLFPAPLTVRDLGAQIFVTAGAREISVRSLRLQVPGGGTVSVSGDIRDLATEPRIHLDTGFQSVKALDIVALWPVGAAENARLWLQENLIGGDLDDGHIALDLAADGAGDLDLVHMEGQARVTDASLWCRKPLPPLERVQGVLEFRTDTISGRVSSGGVRGFDDLLIRGGAFTFSGIDEEDQDADIEVDVEGGLVSALTVLDMEPFGYATELGIRPDDMKGHATGRLVFRFPMLADLEFDQIHVEARADLTDVGLPDVLWGQDLTGGVLTLDLTEDGMDVKGTASVGPVGTTLQWRENFTSDAPFRSRYEITGVVDEAGRAAMGFELPDDGPLSARGPMNLEAVVVRPDKTTTDLDIKLNLAQTELAVPALGWKKSPGQTANLTLSGRLGPKTGQLTIKARAGTEARLDGTLGLATQPEVRPRQFRIRTLQVLDSQVAAEVSWSSDGSAAIVVTDGHIDARALFETSGPGSQPASPPGPDTKPGAAPEKAGTPFSLSASLSSVRMDETLYLDQVTLEGSHSGTEWLRAEARGRIRDGGSFQLAVKPPQAPGGPQPFTFDAEDAGLLLKALGALDTIKGGTFRVSGTISADHTVEGLARMKDFRVTNAPVLAKLVSVAGLTGILDAFKGPGLGFSNARAPFRYKAGVLTLEDASAKGSSIGLTASGTVDRSARTLSIHGAIVPAYAVNSLLGYIPLVGDLLQGGKDEGLFAANYSLSGSLDDPKVSVNPLSVLAPGFLRGIFNIFSNDN
ncbi:AsmA-like C-terminal domain-containing protein [Phaeovibrio sulfidiphilus]|uniref:AsmA-like C-terminal domain-containing protein n=1 Tax=Phaeovibrio sulfidiphilus TaxID=1220600 RepID=A0A8J6YMV7_9PROT|nr:AsmA-like C-terminal domain-containing protein [Phaeovibrio sulfidiphilus]